MMFSAKGQIIGSRRVIVKNPDGTTRIIQQTVASRTITTNTSTGISPSTSPAIVAAGSSGGLSSTTGSQVQQAGNSQTNNLNVSSSPQIQQHKVQIIRGPDGKVSVRGLNPGQQLIQMPDGKLHVLTSTGSASAGPSTSAQSKNLKKKVLVVEY